MASPNLYPQFETNLMSNRKVIKLLLQLKNAKTHGKKYIKVKPHLVRHLLRNCLLSTVANLLYVTKVVSGKRGSQFDVYMPLALTGYIELSWTHFGSEAPNSNTKENFLSYDKVLGIQKTITQP